MTNNPPVISVRDLVVGFGEATVLNHASIDVFEGEILGFVGGSGAGKSVLMRAIIGLLPKRHGTVEVFGSDLAALNGRQRRAIEQRWGVLFQQGALFSSLTALQNVQFPMREYLRLSPRLMDEIALAKLEMVGLRADVRGKYPAELSGGMIKRVALARALALDPDIVFLDEPTSGLDPIGAAEFAELIRTLQHTLGLSVVHGHPRPRQPARGLRPRRRPFRRARDRDRPDRGDARVRTSVASILFRRQARAAGATACDQNHPSLRSRARLNARERTMETKASYIVTGAFTLAVIAGVFGFLYWVQNGAGGGSERSTYRVVFAGSVSGLRPGAAVLFDGMRVGEVTKLALDPHDTRRVEALIALDRATPVRADTKVALAFQGLTGLADVSLAGGAPDAAPVVAGAGGLPTIYADANAGADLTQAARTMLGRIDGMIVENEEAMRASMRNVETVTATLAKNSQRLEAVMAGLETLTGSGDKKGDIGEAAASIRKLADNLDKRTDEISTGLVRFSNSGLKEYEAFAVEGRRTLVELHKAIKNINDHPSQLIFGR
jgi:phospholipid/cholesterol/gamma-HCH transport system ATP-binding protein